MNKYRVSIRTLLLALLLSGTASFLAAQTNSPVMGDFGGVSNFTTYSTEQGLALSSIACSCIDQFGNLWFGTYGGGVSRFDGKTFTNFTEANGLPTNVVLSIFEDSKGNLWFGTNRNGLCKYDGKTIFSYTTQNGLSDNTILSIAEDKEGNLWFGTYGGGVSKYDGKIFITYNVSSGLPGNVIRSIYADKKGIIWFGTIGGGLSRFDGKSFTNFSTKNGLPNDNVFNIIEDDKGNLWLGTMGGGVCRYDGKSFVTFSQKDGLAGDLIWSGFKDKSGNLWFGTKGGGISRFDGKKFSTFTTQQGLPNNYIYSITEDKSGTLWFGTYGGGVARYEGKALTSFTSKQGLAANIIYSILQDKEGNYWFGTYNGGVSKLTAPGFTNDKINKFTNYTTANGLAHNDIKSIFQDKEGNIWFGTIGGGVSRLAPGPGIKIKNYKDADGLANNKINCIHQDRNGVLWFGTSGGGVTKFDGKKFTTVTTADGLVSDIILGIIEDRQGRLWFGTSAGVSRYDGKTFTNFTKKEGLPHDRIFSLLEDKEGAIWFGTDGGGISRYDGKTFLNISEEEGLGNNTVGQIVQDNSGRIFFATNLGLSVLTGWNGSKPVFEIYNKKTGYNIKDVNAGQKGMILDKDGILWIATGDDNSALVRFDYNEIKRNKLTPKVVIQNVKVKEENIDWFALMNPETKEDSLFLHRREVAAYGKCLSGQMKQSLLNLHSGISFVDVTPFYPVPVKLVLPYSQNHITIEFGAIETSKPRQVNYQYILEGYSKEWSPVTNNSTAVFGNMGEGKYIFKVKAQNPNGIWSDPVEYSFEVLPPWYRTYWAYAFYLAALIAAAYGALVLNTRRLLKINTQLEKTIGERTSKIAHQNEELKQQTDQITLQSKKLEEANAAKDKFFRIIAHDLRSPISGLMKLTDIMANESDEFSIQEFAEISRSLNMSADNLYKLLNNLLEWATMQQDGISFNPEVHKISSLIEQGINNVAEHARQKHITIENNIPPNIIITADEKMINTVLRNLLSNAVKFTPNGGKVILYAAQNEHEVEISVKDSGIGIPAEYMDKLFKIEEKIGRPGTEKEPSTGLGLVLCREFVEKHKGTIKAGSVEGEGSTFSFTIPKG